MAANEQVRPAGGRPSKYTEKLAGEICELIASGMSLREICRTRDDIPAMSTVFKWLSENSKFSEQYTRAREVMAETMADEILEIADDGTNDWVERADKNGEVRVVADADHISRSRLRVDSRKWLLSKMMPKKYGDKVSTEVSGPDGGAVQTVKRVEVVVVDPKAK